MKDQMNRLHLGQLKVSFEVETATAYRLMRMSANSEKKDRFELDRHYPVLMDMMLNKRMQYISN